MRSETEIRERLERIEELLENSSGHDMSHLIGQRNILEWVLEEDETVPESRPDHWTGHTDNRRF